jgi:hypothetical protein
MDDSQQPRPDGSDDRRPPDQGASGRSYFSAYLVSETRWNLADLRVRGRYPPPP